MNLFSPEENGSQYENEEIVRMQQDDGKLNTNLSVEFTYHVH